MSQTFRAKLVAWCNCKEVENSNWLGFVTLDKAKVFAREWYKTEHVGCHKLIKIYKDGDRMPILKYETKVKNDKRKK